MQDHVLWDPDFAALELVHIVSVVIEGADDLSLAVALVVVGEHICVCLDVSKVAVNRVGEDTHVVFLDNVLEVEGQDACAVSLGIVKVEDARVVVLGIVPEMANEHACAVVLDGLGVVGETDRCVPRLALPDVARGGGEP